ncbi:hypothetical protein [Photobacterium leiognathi]|uniref:hypothetical protein n=1 Tax=Photobacterium leiognathi TaxID=553611 RepID=UPI00076A53B7|nr:hypothetical protein [Photobacterium leiognathi]PSV01437.1 hypothetical protein C0W80_11180 [Photobacterium leiognathi subsp. mandapamensis]
MEEILQLSKSPAFWFSSIFIAFLMSLFASFTKDWIEELKLKISKRRQLKRTNNEKAFLEKVNELTNDPMLVSVYLSNIIFQKIRNVLYYVITYVMMCFALNNVVNGNFDAALIFGGVSLFVFAIPVQLTASKINRMSSLVNAVIKEDNEHFKH